MAIKLQRAPKASPAMIEAGNSNSREAKALQKTTRAVSALMKTRKMQRGVPLACSSLSGMYLHRVTERHTLASQGLNRTCDQ